MDRLPDPVVGQLRKAGKNIVDITVRNLAMSSAMVIVHKRNNDASQKESSERVACRCVELLRLLDPYQVKTRIEVLLLAVSENIGEDVNFINKWKYDEEQLEFIKNNILQIADN